MPLGELYDPTRGYLVNDTVLIEAEVSVRKVLDYWAYDSKKETGFVGLKNQGATCYMNSLLETLYHIPYFRKVGHMSFFYSFQFATSGFHQIRDKTSQYCSVPVGCLPYANN